MQQANLEIDEGLQTELVRRVMALEGREETLRLNNLQLESTIETLGEHTSVSPTDIRALANELVRASAVTRTPTVAENNVSMLTPARLKLVGSGLTTMFCIFMAWQLFAPVIPGPGNTQLPSSALPKAIGEGGLYHKKAMLGSAMADVSVMRMMFHEYAIQMSEFPQSMDDLRLDAKTMVSRNIRSIEIEKSGVILVKLPKKMGSDIHLKLVPELVMGGHSIEWSCYSNLPSYVLMGTSCENG